MRLNTIAKVGKHEVYSGMTHAFVYTDGVKSVVTDTPYEAVLCAPREVRPQLMKQWLDRNDGVVTPMYEEIAKENLLTENEYKDR